MAGLLDSGRWEILPQDPQAERALVDACNVPAIVARALVARGVRGVEEARAFLSPSLERDWHDPLLIPGMDEAAGRLCRALERGERIAVFGDFDVDGMSASCILTLGLRQLGAKVDPYIPDRFEEGYGLSREALERVISSSSPDLVVTVDNGIAARDEVAWLVSQGIDVVVTDHHEPAELVPEGVPVTDPKLSHDCPSRELAGAGVALKLLQLLGERRGDPQLWRHYTEVATLGTISDMMRLASENRALVADGIGRMRLTERPGIVALAAMAGVDLSEVTADSLPFSLIPRLNAAGRMGNTDLAFRLLLTNDAQEAAELAARLEEVNAERRAIESELTEAAMGKVAESYAGGRVVVVGGEGWHEGVKGIVASRIVNRYHVPSILFTISDGVARGSGRSVGSVDLFHAVEQCSDLLIRFGGHAGAVGVTCEASRLDELRGRLERILGELPPEQFESRGEICALVGLEELTVANIDSLELLQPFGQGNKKPLLAALGVSMHSRARVGAAGNHLRFVATDGISSVSAIMFRTPDIERAASCDEVVDLVFEPVSETWQGRTKPKMMVKDILFRDQPPQPPDEEAPEPPEQDARAERSRLSALGYAALTDELRRQLVGSSELLPAQAKALSLLAEGRSALCVMATGRGKSLIFQLHAAREALAHGRASIFVYPLRALVADQALHLAAAFGGWGLRACVLTGESTQEERDELYSQLAQGKVDVVLTTPEFLAIHAGRLSASGRVGFLVLDESHHADASRGAGRASYSKLPEVLSKLGDPCVLAVTATADTQAAQEICSLARIRRSDVIVDVSSRDNLGVVDLRESRDRDAALASIVATGQKTVVYVNSREQSAGLVRMLRHAVPDLAWRIGFYHAGLTRAQRCRVERCFRHGELCCIVSTSAFGEGVNLPDIRNVVLYHLPFGSVEFNQMSGRAGRDGQDARIYPLFGSRDASLNERILALSSPSRPELAVLYRTLKSALGSPDASQGRPLEDEQIAELASRNDPRASLDARSVSCGLAIFEELGLVGERWLAGKRQLFLPPAAQRVQLDRSVRYLEGKWQREEFAAFRDWVLSCSPEEMLERINRPIAPDFGHVAGSDEGSS